MSNCKIKKMTGRHIFDSRGTPTVEASVLLENGVLASASVPSGASTGMYEAFELRDKENDFYGKGVSRAINNINTVLAGALEGISADNQALVDDIMIKADGTKNKSNLGANATLAVSLAVSKASAASYKLPLFKYLGGASARVLPTPMMNILNGGAHADNNLDIQEFMIVPSGFSTFHEAMKAGVEIYMALKLLLKDKGLSTAVGDEGGFAPSLEDEYKALELICNAVEKAGYAPGKDVFIALDIASSEWADEGENYTLPKRGKRMSSDELSLYYSDIIDKFPVISIEDPFSENDWKAFERFTKKHKGLQIVGDDLFVTNADRLQIGIDNSCANAILIKPNQIGTLTETLEVIRLAKNNGYKTVISHRSGETQDSTIADIAVAVNSGQIKTGAPARGERVAKYNRLLRIESCLGVGALYSK